MPQASRLMTRPYSYQLVRRIDTGILPFTTKCNFFQNGVDHKIIPSPLTRSIQTTKLPTIFTNSDKCEPAAMKG